VFTSALCASLRFIKQPELKWGVATGLAYGAAALIKPAALVVGGVFLLVGLRPSLKSLTIGLCFLILPGAWVLRNLAATGHPVYTLQGNFVLLQYPAAGVIAMDQGRSRRDVLQELEAALAAEGYGPDADQVLRSRAYKKRAIDILKQHPWNMTKYSLMGAARILAGTGLEMTVDLFKSESARAGLDGSELKITGGGTRALLKAFPLLIPLQVFYMSFLLAGYLLFCRGLARLTKAGQGRWAAFLLLSILAILFISVLPEGTYRLRLQFVPLLAFGIAAAFGSPDNSSDRRYLS
jgi:hypothetical protein